MGIILNSLIFETIQGEGVHAGVPSFFIRLQGCNVRCFFCDEKSTWGRVRTGDASKIKDAVELEPEEIIEKLKILNPSLKRIVITGGEPTEQSLNALIKALVDGGYKVAVETAASGEYLDDLFDAPVWITFSPKEIYSENGQPYNRGIWGKCSEIKFVVASDKAINYLLETIIPEKEKANNDCPVFITPDWFNFEENKARVLELCSKYPEKFRVGAQMHKYLGVK